MVNKKLFALISLIAALAAIDSGFTASRAPTKKVVTSGTHAGLYDIIVPGSTQNLAVASISGQSTALTSGVTVVELTPTQNMYVKFGSSPTATTADILLLSGITRRFGVPTDADKIAAIRQSADGTLSIVEGAP